MSAKWANSSGTPVVIGGMADQQAPSALLSNGVTAGSSVRDAITITAPATPHTLSGTWTTVTGSLASDASGIYVYLPTNTTGATDTSTILEIGIGAASSEVLWGKVLAGYHTEGDLLWLPGHIASGSRVSARLQSAVANASIIPFFYFTAEKSEHFGTPFVIGANTAASQGTVLTPHASVNTKGAWTQLTASSASAIAAISVMVQGAGGTAMNSSAILVDIGIGGSGSEVVIMPDLYYLGNSAEFYRWRSPTTLGRYIPAGTRISARYARANANNAVDLLLHAAPPT